jgi:hypothetical protein
VILLPGGVGGRVIREALPYPDYMSMKRATRDHRKIIYNNSPIQEVKDENKDDGVVRN